MELKAYHVLRAEEVKRMGLQKRFVGMTGAQAIADVATERALAGDARMMELLLDRVEGKATQPVEVSGPNCGPIEMMERATDDELDALERIWRGMLARANQARAGGCFAGAGWRQ